MAGSPIEHPLTFTPAGTYEPETGSLLPVELGKPLKSIRECAIPLGGCVLIDQGCPRTCVLHASHQFASAGTRGRRECASGALRSAFAASGAGRAQGEQP